jgi:hypothetical protein
MTTTLTNNDVTYLPWETEPDESCHLRDAVIQGFRNSGYRPLSKIKCEVLDGIVVILGVVPSFFLKQIAQTIILRIGQVKIKNNLKVQDDPYYETESL